MIVVQPKIDLLKYRSDSPQWRIWNVTKNDFPPYSLVSLARFPGRAKLALTAFDSYPETKRHVDDYFVDHQLTYQAYSGPAETQGEESETQDVSDAFSQVPEKYLATFDNFIRKDGNGLATQHWPVLVRYTGDLSDIPDTWPRYAVPDLENYGVKYDELGPFQILGIDPDSIKVPLVWIAPRHIAYRDAWAIGAVDSIDGVDTQVYQELFGGIEAINSPGGGDILTIEDGRIVAHYGGMYRCSVTAVANGSIDGFAGNFRLAFIEPGNTGNIPLPSGRGTATGSYGWLPLGTNISESHTHGLTITGGASSPRFWDRMTSTIHYTADFQISDPAYIPWQARLMWNGGEGESLTRVRYSIEYMGPVRSVIPGG